MTDYKVTIDLNDYTLGKLNDGFNMNVFKGVKTASVQGALPTVWISTDDFSNSVTINWSEKYGGYFSNTLVSQGANIVIKTQQKMNAGDVITLHKAGSSSVSTEGGVSGAFSYQILQEKEWTCGLMVAPEGKKLAPVCAFPIYGAVGDVIEPYEKILILFTKDPMDTGAVVETAVSKSVSIVLSTAAPEISVAFDINKGWDTGGSTQAKENPANFALAPELIVPSATLENNARRLLAA